MQPNQTLTEKLKSIALTFKGLEVADKKHKSFIAQEVREIELFLVANHVRLPFSMKTNDGTVFVWHLASNNSNSYRRWKICITLPGADRPIFFRSAPVDIQRKYRKSLYDFMDKFQAYIESLNEAVQFSNEE